MFFSCSSLSSLDLFNFNINHGIDMSDMFLGMNKSCNLICNIIK